MKQAPQILLLGAGRSASVVIDYLFGQCAQRGWTLMLGDTQPELIEARLQGHPAGRALLLSPEDPGVRQAAIREADFVISLLPPPLHPEVALECLEAGVSMATASYVAAEIQELSGAFAEKGLLFLGEMGLDPGIDHMSAMQQIHAIQAEGGVMQAFYSHTGGLVAPESDDNPWHYKISWNPRNVVLAGQSTAQFIVDGAFRFVPYNRMFADPLPLQIEGYGDFEVYPNRDSLLYRDLYGMPEIPTLMRGTIRKAGFCAGWNAIVKLGLADATHPIVHSADLSYARWISGYVPAGPGSLEQRTAAFLGLDEQGAVMHQLRWLGLFSEERIPVSNASPAFILEDLLLRKWKLGPTDRDLIIMQHTFEYEQDGEMHRLTASLALEGADHVRTAMSQTVGLPLGIFALQYLEGKIALRGVHIPVIPEIYNPVLAELEAFGVSFRETRERIA